MHDCLGRSCSPGNCRYTAGCWGGTKFGYTRFEPVNAILAILGFYNLAIAAFNLIPASPLDGAIAWKIVPELFRRQRNKPNRPQYRSTR
ncbi:MAG TPA: site-2 protease family protein [Candidatus Angelobacter sp.]|nr:site-2 protease family protein [Candidatus Angelobacter sp.]